MSIPSISLSKFPHSDRVKAWLLAGETIELIERGKVIARIIPEEPKEALVSEPSPRRRQGRPRRKG
jgi:antitoxin (DNA-binding transcriptional repressor) of toxin-antitoxin stability system